jgi:transposase
VDSQEPQGGGAHQERVSLPGKIFARLKAPRPAHCRKNEKEAAAFRSGLLNEFVKLGLPDCAKVRVWVSDEMRFGLQPVTRRVWSLRGERPVAPNDPRYQWGYTYGAIEVGGEGAAEFIHTPTVNLATSLEFLRELAASDPGSHHVVIWDGAGFHQRNGDKSLPANVSLIKLPAYSPELNPIEKLWDVVKDRICNVRWKNLDALEAAITHVLREYWTTPSLVKSLVGEGWMALQANCSNLAVHAI